VAHDDDPGGADGPGSDPDRRAHAVDGAPLVDGRRQRRERNRTAVVDALLDRYRQGDLNPATDDLAAAAGISPRSLFRYFTDLDDLVRAAIVRQQGHLAPRYLVPVDPETPLPRRIDGFVTARVDLLEAMGPVAEVARLRARDHPVIATELARIRTTLRRQVATLFGRELAALGDDGPATLALVDVAASWEAHHLLRHDQGLDRPGTEAALVLGLTRLLVPAAARAGDRPGTDG
jgi:AcrR family transcriptional regulator